MKIAAAVVLASALVAAQGQPPGAARPGEIPSAKAPAPPAAGANPNTHPITTTGTIRGRITLADGRPARRASIQLVSSAERATAADDEGKYEFTELPPESYRLSAGKPGYLVLEYGQEHAFERGKMIVLGEGQTLENMDIRLPASGSISGRIVDENGDPVEAVTVRLKQLQFVANRRQLMDVAAAGGRATDDTGHYRIFGVPPGQYVVVASTTERLPAPVNQNGGNVNNLPPERAAADLPGYAATYYPGTFAVTEAQPVTVALSQDVSSIDFALAPAPTAQISGTVSDSRGLPMTVLLNRSQRSGGFAGPPVRGIAKADGGFRFDNLPPGEYALQTTGPRRDSAIRARFRVRVRHGRRPEHLGRAPPGFARIDDLRTRRLRRLAADARPPAVQLGAWPTDFDSGPMVSGDSARTRPAPDGRFMLGGLHGPRRLRLLQAPSSWSLKAVRVNGIDVTDQVLMFGTRQESSSDVEVVLTNRGPSISGSAVDSEGRRVLDYSVVAFAPDPQRWYYGSRFMGYARPKHDGTFTLSGLAAGEYDLVAVDSLQGAEGWGEWQDPEFLRAHRAGRNESDPRRRTAHVAHTEGRRTLILPRWASSRGRNSTLGGRVRLQLIEKTAAAAPPRDLHELTRARVSSNGGALWRRGLRRSGRGRCVVRHAVIHDGRLARCQRT